MPTKQYFESIIEKINILLSEFEENEFLIILAEALKNNLEENSLENETLEKIEIFIKEY